MASQENSAEERIILATVTCIEKQGIEKLTIRSIAKEAGVNSAAINYYFRSKDNLVAQVMETTLNHLFEDLEEIADDESLDPPARICEMLDYLIDGATRYPGITRAHFYRAMSARGPGDPFATKMNAVLGRLRDRLIEESGTQADPQRARALNFHLVGLFSAAMLPAVMPSFYREFSGIDFRDSRTRKSYVRTIAKVTDVGRLIDG